MSRGGWSVIATEASYMIARDGVNDPGGIDLADHIVGSVRDIQIAGGVDENSLRASEACLYINIAAVVVADG